MLALIVGPSGAGKDTLLARAQAALADDPRVRFVRRQITRPAGPATDAEQHEPLDPESFALRRAAGAYALAWEAHGLSYAIPADIALDLAEGHLVVANVSRTAVAEAARRFAVHVIEVTASPEVLARRLQGRGREDAADIAGRLARPAAIAATCPVTTITNDGTPEEGAAKLVALLRSLAAASRPPS